MLRGKTRGYRRHPQLERFRSHHEPVAMIGAYLRGVYEESVARGYRFDRTKIAEPAAEVVVEETEAQPEPHPIFTIVPGPKRRWEKAVDPES